MITLEQIRTRFTELVTEWSGIQHIEVEYPNNPSGSLEAAGLPIWARLSILNGLSTAPEIGLGACVRRTGLLKIQLFVPLHTGTLRITQVADTLVEKFQLYTDNVYQIECFVASAGEVGYPGETQDGGHFGLMITVPFRAY